MGYRKASLIELDIGLSMRLERDLGVMLLMLEQQCSQTHPLVPLLLSMIQLKLTLC